MADEQLKIKIGADVGQAVKGINEVSTSLKKLTPGSAQATMAMTNLSRVVQDAPFGFIGIANNIEPLLLSFRSLAAEAKGTGGALKAIGQSLLGGGGLILAFGALSFVMSGGISKIKEAIREFFSAKVAVDAFSKAMFEANKEAGGEIARLQLLTSAARDQTRSLEERLNAVNALRKEFPDYFANLSREAILNGKVTDAVNKTRDAIISRARATALQDRIGKIETELLDNEIKRLAVADKLTGAQIKLTAAEETAARVRAASDKNLATSLGEAGIQRISAEKVAVDQLTGSYLSLDAAATKLKSERETLLKLFEDTDANIDTNTKGLNLKPKSVKITPDQVTVGTENIKLDEIEVPASRFSVADMFGKIRQPFGDLVLAYNEVAIAAGEVRARNEEIARGLTEHLTPAFTNFFDDLLSGSKTTFADFGKAILGVIKKLIAAAAAAAVLAAIISVATGGAANIAGGGMSFLGAFKSLGGGIGLDFTKFSANRGTGTGALMGAARGGSSGTLQAVVRGQDLLLVMRRASDDKNRLG